MDSIKKKMLSLSTETATALADIERYEQITVESTARADKTEEEVRHLQRKLQKVEAKYDACLSQFLSVNSRLEEREKEYTIMEEEVSNLMRKMLLVEEEVQREDLRLGQVIMDMCNESMRADKSVRAQKKLEHRQIANEESIDILEAQLREARFMVADSERKHDDIARIMPRMDEDLLRAIERAENGDRKLVQLEDDLKVIGNKLQILEVNEERALAREDKYQKQLRDLNERLKFVETRAENSEMDIQRQQMRIDQIEDDILNEKAKIRTVHQEVNGTLIDLDM